MKKFFLATIIVTLLAGLVACGRERQTDQPKSITSSNAQAKTISAEELAPPVEGKRLPKTEEKGLVIVDEQGVLKGYKQVPVLFNSYGAWIDEQGESMADKDARKVFAEQPVYAEATIRFNEGLVDFDTPQREILLATYGAEEPMSIKKNDDIFIRRRLNELIKQWEHDQSLLIQISPKAEGACDLYNKILGVDPEPVPIYQNAAGDWYDQNCELVSEEAVTTWFASHPQCAKLTQAFMERAREKDMLRYASYLTLSSFRLGYAWKIGSEGYRAQRNGEEQNLEDYTPPSGYKWWRKELLRLEKTELPEFTSEPMPEEFFETPAPEKPERSEEISVPNQPMSGKNISTPDISAYNPT